MYTGDLNGVLNTEITPKEIRCMQQDQRTFAPDVVNYYNTLVEKCGAPPTEANHSTEQAKNSFYECQMKINNSRQMMHTINTIRDDCDWNSGQNN